MSPPENPQSPEIHDHSGQPDHLERTADPALASTEEVAARRRVGKALRAVMHDTVGRHAEIETLHAFAEDLERWDARIGAGADRRRPPSTHGQNPFHEPPGEGATLDPGYDERPFGGWSSPFSLELSIVRRGDQLHTEFMLRPAHEGAPGRSHGGIIAGLFDDLTGYVLQLAQAAAFTGELKVRYEKPIPLGVTLHAKAWLVRHEGRKLFINAELWHGSERLAFCESIYIAPR